MKIFKESLSKRLIRLIESILLEDKMTLSQAKDIFNLSSIPNSQELKSLYKKLALQNHPDRGGSEQKMALINAAYDILSNNSGIGGLKNNPEAEQKSFERKLAQILTAKKVADEQDSKMDSFIETLKEHFKKLSGGKYEFQGEYKSNKPEIDKYELKSPRDIYGYPFTLYVRFLISLYTEDREIVFDIMLDTLINYPNDNAIATPDMNVSVVCNCIVNGRKNKIFQRNWGNTMNSSVIFDDARQIFTNGKLEKILSGKARTKENSKFSKRDAIAYCTKVMNGNSYTSGKDTYIDIPLEKELSEGKLFVRLRRAVIDRLPFWQILSVRKKTKYSSEILNQIYVSMGEKEENFGELKDIVREFDGNREKLVERLKGMNKKF